VLAHVTLQREHPDQRGTHAYQPRSSRR
jgi:hypothetical protein